MNIRDGDYVAIRVRIGGEEADIQLGPTALRLADPNLLGELVDAIRRISSRTHGERQ